jgi:hypothetical protein
MSIYRYVDFRLTNPNPTNIQAMNLHKLRIIGFTHGQSLCAHCGTGIKNLVIVRDADGVTHHIGTDCAMRVGLDPQQIRNRRTDEQQAKMNSTTAERAKRDAERAEVYRAKIAARTAEVAHISAQLRAIGGEFLLSLADQVECGTLSGKQAYYAVKAIHGRRTKANADQYDLNQWLCTNSEAL